MPQVIIRGPFGELDLCEQLGSRTEYGRRQTGGLDWIEEEFGSNKRQAKAEQPKPGSFVTGSAI
jgi:hypothetical protein